jgi:ABC-2 type transport system ATP-binding protein
MSCIIQVEQLCKIFHRPQRRGWLRKLRGAGQSASSHGEAAEVVKVALHPTSFTVAPGETIAFIGPNGAGKSTTIKMLTGILHPTSGSARVAGLCPWDERVALSYKIGTVFGQKSQLWYHLPPADTFELMGKVYSLPKADYKKRRDELVERFGLGPIWSTPVRKLSLGERMRCEIALSFLHRPEILFLDEPTVGLDVVVKQTIRELIRERNRAEGVTVFLTSHDATDIESLCQRVLVINHGRLLFDGPTSQLVSRFLHYKEVWLDVAEPSFSFAREGVDIHREAGNSVRLVVDLSRAPMDAVLSEIFQRFTVRDVSIREPSMEEIIRAIYVESEKLEVALN